MREQRFESERRKLERECEAKNRAHVENYYQYRRMKEALLEQKSSEEAQHSGVILDKKEGLHESFMNR